ncbi:MAG: hypothetical protein RMJ60_01380, partial [Anaerolineales bacterium]|nr:hypothetical protein [Anaerolineales bacterium]
IHNWNVFWQGVDVAHAWGFRPIFVLVDGVDSQERDLDFMQALLYPLFEQLATVQSKNLFFKFFLPSELKEVAEKAIKDLYPHPVFSIMIEWDDPSLSSLLTQRLRTAAPSRRYPGLDSLAKPGLDLEQKVIQAAKGSPRRLLRLVSALIDAHILHQPDALLFDQVDWEIALHSFQKGHP